MSRIFTNQEMFQALLDGGPELVLCYIDGVLAGVVGTIPTGVARYDLNWSVHELKQETFLNLLKIGQRGSIKHYGNFPAYAWRVAFNICRNRWRTNKTRRPSDPDSEDPFLLLQQHTGPLEEVPLERLCYREEVASADWFLGKYLTDEQHYMLELHKLYGYTYAEIGDELGMSEGAAKMRVKRLIERLKLLVNPFERS